MKVKRNKKKDVGTLIVDLDDVLVSFRQHYDRWLGHRTGLDLSPHSDVYYITEPLVREGWDPDELFGEFIQERGFYTLPPCAGMVTLLQDVSDLGVRIHAVTSRPSDVEVCKDDTFNWIMEWAVPFDDVTFDTQKSKWLSDASGYKRDDLVAVLEDAPRYIQDYSDDGYRVISPMTPYNSHLFGTENLIFYESTDTLRDLLLEIIRERVKLQSKSNTKKKR